jgi:hypothetical protein
MIQGDKGIASALVRQGFMPCSPFTPTVVISTRALELFRNIHLRCPSLAVQAFVKGLCDNHQVPYRPYLSQQFSISYDLYLSIRNSIEARVRAALNRDFQHWRIKNTCPACSYKLQGETKLVFDMLVTMDGNDSLKRILRRDAAPDLVGDGEPELGESCELKDSRDASGDYFLSRDKVDKWSREVLEEIFPGDEATASCLTSVIIYD